MDSYYLQAAYKDENTLIMKLAFWWKSASPTRLGMEIDAQT